jgi:hypothetical protein
MIASSRYTIVSGYLTVPPLCVSTASTYHQQVSIFASGPYFATYPVVSPVGTGSEVVRTPEVLRPVADDPADKHRVELRMNVLILSEEVGF